MSIDLNSDMGESFGAYTLGNDEALMAYVTSANIACGFHGGDPLVMERTVRLAVEHGVAIGAHPGYRDLVGFGRRTLLATPEEIEGDVLYQIGALAAFTRAALAPLVHVKAHGALHNWAGEHPDIARAIARAIARFDPSLVLVCLAGSALIDAAREFGLRVAREGYADRAYNRDSTLRSRREPGAVITDPARAAAQALQIAREQTVTTPEGETIPLTADTLCLHGDNPAAVENAKAVRQLLEQNGVTVSALRLVD